MAESTKRQEINRKSVHIAGLVLLPISYWNAALVPWLLLILCVGYWGIEALATSGSPIPHLQKFINSCKRADRNNRIDPGPFYLAAGVGLSFLFLPLRAAQVGLICVTIADAAASIAPYYIPSRSKLPHSGLKSWTGSAAFFVTAAAGSAFFLNWWQALVIAGIGTLLESFPPPDIDNVTVPLGVALAVSVMGWA